VIVFRLGLLASLALLAACARVPPTLQGAFPPLTVAQAQAQAQGVTGERVRWGGDVVSTTPQTGDTCLEIVSKPLARTARPIPADETFGRFIACASGFYDPAVYSPGREVTVVGTLEEPTSGKVGEYDYSFPRLRAESVYLWPKRELRDVAYYPYGVWGYPGWGWGWGAGWGWGPYWGGGWYRGGRFIGRTVRPGRPR
jgi:Slp family outer membrane lipoprotein